MDKDRIIHVRMTDNTKDRMWTMANLLDISLTALANQAIKKYLKELENEENKKPS